MQKLKIWETNNTKNSRVKRMHNVLSNDIYESELRHASLNAHISNEVEGGMT